MERAENTARILDVNLQLQLDMPRLSVEERNETWEPVLKSIGDEDLFKKMYDAATNETVIDFLTLNVKNPNSIINCVTNSRENARHVREQISLEMWEELNRLYLWLKTQTLKKIMQVSPYEFFAHIKNMSHLFQGITDCTMTNGEDWDFIQVGKYLERADQTTRLLDANDEIFVKQPTNSRTTATLQWSAILRSCSAHDAFRKFYVAQVEPRKVIEFLILNEFFPRSIRYCAHQLNHSLRRISGCKEEHFTNMAEKLSGRLVSELNYSTLDDIDSIGVHAFMDQLQLKMIGIGEAIYKTYLFFPPPTVNAPQTQNQTVAAATPLVPSSTAPTV